MVNKFTSVGISFRIWSLTCIFVTIGLYLNEVNNMSSIDFLTLVIIGAAVIICSLPAFLMLLIFIPLINNVTLRWQVKVLRLLLVELVITTLVAAIAGMIGLPLTYNHQPGQFIYIGFFVFSLLFINCAASTLIISKRIFNYFFDNIAPEISYQQIIQLFFSNTSKNNSAMETIHYDNQPQPQSNKLLVKGLTTGALILLMLIPTIFINNLITERQARQQEVVTEVSSKWASSQTLSGPYIVVPYNEQAVNSEGKPAFIKRQLILLADDLDVTGNIFPENRPRSIYKVLLYKSALSFKGTFRPDWPADINIANIDFTNAKICFGLSDFKGIEEEIVVDFNGQKIALNPGLPINDLDTVGLSAPVNFTVDAIKEGMAFQMNVKIKGSEQLHFMPLSANSKFSISSSWPNPSFDGNNLPNDRQVTEKGFVAKWNFNRANLPFGTVMQQGTFKKSNLAFGVSMVQPADQYSKTMRSAKYAILFIGLTFALFFIVEILQRKPFHPVQYVLVGLALVIFYTLLLSISEYLLFDQAYLIAAAATISLISMYSKSHFNNWKSAGVFASVLSGLYGFIFVLIRLEDTALIVGSIGLFIVLALVMFASRKINWYGNNGLSAIKNPVTV